jgi:cation:H+ antiporter
LLLVSLGLILLASVLFTNAIEIFGHRLKVHQGAVGSVLAAVGTAMPETIIPIIAIVLAHLNGTGAAEGEGVAIGAIAGAPFMLATLAFFITGSAVVVYSLLGKRSRQMSIEPRVLTRDLTYFIIVYTVAVATTFLPALLAVRVPIAIFLLLSYVYYLKKTFAGESAQMEEIDHLSIARLFRLKLTMTLVVIQLVLSLAVMIYGAHLFVQSVETFSRMLSVPSLVLALIIAPIATELPEKFNSVIWIGKRKDVLALGNMTGAMVFQSSFPVIFGILFTRWDLMQDGGVTIASAVLALISACLMLAYVKIRKGMSPFFLMLGGLLYGAFILFIVYRDDMARLFH